MESGVVAGTDRVHGRRQRKNEQKGIQKKLYRKRESVSPYILGSRVLQV